MNRPIILVTGANGGVGLGICERILTQLSSPSPKDTALLKNGRTEAAGTTFDAGEGCTLILACRNEAKARAAAASLEALLESFTKEKDELDTDEPIGKSSAMDSSSVQELQSRYVTDRSASVSQRNAAAGALYRKKFVRGTRIEISPLDLASLKSTQAFVASVQQRYPYLTHLILNAGGAAWSGINWPYAFFEIVTNLHRAVTRPSYKLQRPSEKTADGFGWVWEINCGMHYVLAKELAPMMRASPYNAPSRIIWTGSLEASRSDYHPDDFQCLDPKTTPHAYESTKYQCELAALAMDERFREHSRGPRVYTAHPGIVASSIFSEVIHVLLLSLMKLVFYAARWTFSPHHPIEAYKGAVAASYVALAPAEDLDSTVRYGAQCTWSGQEYVFPGRLDGWQPSEEDPPENQVMDLARDLLHRYDLALGPNASTHKSTYDRKP
ncbi:3beta-hydroxysteroid 3-dehydrogenase [Malassezia psittaci]|uniref:3beta-hydroxysteroid 3-dehydrogenase n=1 Tax=Malassezia psittaci TaxID=1821823 RepID=A0AAF0JEA7_9BASI|nr:3beta-hydroxysteroid 3-dehydrogenase [Malassezia psittaci]